MCRHRSIFIVMLIFVCFSAKAFAEPTLLVGFIDEHWITGLTFQHSQRELVGFFGYKEDFSPVPLLLQIMTIILLDMQ